MTRLEMFSGLARSTAAVALLGIVAMACSSTSSTSSATVSHIGLGPNPCTVTTSGNTQMSATATLPDGSSKPITGDAKWTVSNESATINAAGLLVGTKVGVVTVTATYEGATATIDCTVD